MKYYGYAQKVATAAEMLISHFPKADSIVRMCKGNRRFELNEKAELIGISWDYYDKVYVGGNKLIYTPEHGNSETLCTFPGWDLLLQDANAGNVMRRVIRTS